MFAYFKHTGFSHLVLQVVLVACVLNDSICVYCGLLVEVTWCSCGSGSVFHVVVLFCVLFLLLMCTFQLR